MEHEEGGVTLGQRSFDDMGAPLHAVPFCVLDLETTGATAADCEITEIGAVKYVGGELEGTFQTLVNPGVPIPPMITVLTGITQMMVVEAPEVGEALPSLLEFIGDAVIVGHNVRFDMSFLNAAATRLGYGRLPNRTVDTLGLARRLVRSETRSLKLAALAAHFRSPIAPTHRALDDARATAHVFWSLLERAGTIGVTHLEDLLRLPTARGAPHYKKIALTEVLPRSPGVYLFRDRNGEVIYVGKAKNLRTRARSYFYGDDRRSIDQMLRDLDEIDHRVCPTELEAEITELRLIHAHRPRYNRRSRPPKSPHWVKLTDERFPRLSMVRSIKDDGCLYLGPFRNRRQANVVVEAIWDAVPVRRCLTRGGQRSPACNFAQLGVAVCPCDGSMSEEEYAVIVRRLVEGVTEEPAILLDPLLQRIREHASGRRFEEAATVRDRHAALTTALDRRRSWLALQETGTLWAADDAGDNVLVEAGRLGATWPGDAAPIRGLFSTEPATSQVPASVAVAEEAQLLWRWLNRPGVVIVDAERPLAVPCAPLERLTRIAV
jgi:DNA polymerase-3 subunit epsilon